MGLCTPRSAGTASALGFRDLVLLMSGDSPFGGPESARAGAERQPPRLSGSPLSEAALLELLRDEPSRGAPLFYDRYQREVNRLVWRLLGADPEHDDVVQQVFLVAFRRIADVREAEKLTAWVRTVTVNAVYDEIRKRKVRRLFLRDAVPNEVHPSLVHDVEVRDFLLRAKRVLDLMPTSERMVFLLHVLEGKELLEISELCGHSTATAKRRLARANRRFDRLLSREPELGRMLARARPDPDETGAAGGSP